MKQTPSQISSIRTVRTSFCKDPRRQEKAFQKEFFHFGSFSLLFEKFGSVFSSFGHTYTRRECSSSLCSSLQLTLATRPEFCSRAKFSTRKCPRRENFTWKKSSRAGLPTRSSPGTSSTLSRRVSTRSTPPNPSTQRLQECT